MIKSNFPSAPPRIFNENKKIEKIKKIRKYSNFNDKKRIILVSEYINSHIFNKKLIIKKHLKYILGMFLFVKSK